MKKIILLALIVNALYGCQTATPEQKTEKLLGDFYIRYLQAERQLRAEATFSKGDSLQQSPGIKMALVHFDDVSMGARNLGEGGLRYKYEKEKDFDPLHRFHFKDQQGNELTQKMELSPISNFEVATPARLSKGIDIKWGGKPLASDEQLILLFTDVEGKAAVLQVDGPTARAEIVLGPEKLEGIAKGESNLYLVKKKRSTFTSPAFDATTLFEFYSNTLQLTLTE